MGCKDRGAYKAFSFEYIQYALVSRRPAEPILSLSGGFGCPGEGAVCQRDKMVRSHSALPWSPPPPAPNRRTEEQNLHQQAPLTATFLHSSRPFFPSASYALFRICGFRALALSTSTFVQNICFCLIDYDIQFILWCSSIFCYLFFSAGLVIFMPVQLLEVHFGLISDGSADERSLHPII